ARASLAPPRVGGPRGGAPPPPVDDPRGDGRCRDQALAAEGDGQTHGRSSIWHRGGAGSDRAPVVRPRLWPPRAAPRGSEQGPDDLQGGDAGGVGERVERPERRAPALPLPGPH